MKTDGQKHTGVFWGYLVSFALFIFLPAIIAGVLGIDAIDLEQQRAFDAARNSLETRLTQFVCNVDQDIFLNKVARGAWFKLKNKTRESGSIEAYIKSLQKFLPIEFDLYLFDADRKLTTPQTVRLKSRYVASKLWDLVTANPTNQSRLFKKIRKPVKALLGEEFKAAQLLEKKDGLLPIIVNHEAGRIYWNEDDKSGVGIILVFWQIPDLAFRIKHQTAMESDRFAQGYARLSRGRLLDFGKRRSEERQIEATNARLAFMNQPYFYSDEQIWIGRKIEQSWLAVSEKFSKKRFELWQKNLFSLLGFLVLLALLVTIKVNLHLSIRIKLTVLFITAVFIPVMGFLFLGYQYHSDREQTLIAEVANQSRQSLFNLDESFRNLGEAFVPEIRKILPMLVSDDKAMIRSRLKPRIENNEIVTVEVRDVAAKITFTQVNELFFEGMKDVSEAFSRFCIDTALGTSLGDSVDPIVGMIVKAPEGGMFFLFDRPGEIHPLEFGPVPLLIFWQIIENIRAEKFYVFIVQSASILLKKRVEAELKKRYLNRGEDPFLVVARNNSSGEWFPARPVNDPDLKHFAERLQFSDKPIDAELAVRGEKYLVTGQRGKNASEYSFFSFYPRRLIDDNLQRIRLAIIFCMLAFIAVSILAGNILSSTFLEPVRKLSEGVAAINRRDSCFRIDACQNDEFGDLSVSFNHMIEDLKEMQLAKDVQESLLPSGFPEIPGYQIKFINRMASDVGGDYFDLHRLDDDRICVLIGDVTGHGVSSALVMAMAKAIVYQGLQEKHSLIKLFDDLNLTIHTYFKIPPARKMITLFAAIIETSAGKISCVNAGHNFPVKIRADGKIEDFSAVHLPIGASSKLRNLELHNYKVQNNEVVIFYTDGLIEVKNRSGEMYGYERFRKHMLELGDFSAQQILDALVKRYDEFLGDCEPDDDLTIIVLKRDSLATAS